MPTRSLISGLLLLLGGSAWAQDEPPQVGRPAHFSDAIGTSFQVTLHAPFEATVDEPFTLTVRVRAVGPWRRPPQRIDLNEVDGFADSFRIDRSQSDLPDREMPTPRPSWTIDRRQRPPRGVHVRETPAEQRTWEFDYTLRPRALTVEEIPAVPLAYYRPPRNPALPGSFPTTFADALPLKVLAKVAPKPPVVKLDAPPSVLQVATWPAVRRYGVPFRLASWSDIIILVLLPPLLALSWYAVWRWCYPDAARLAKRRQSRAARQALAELSQVKGNGADHACQVAEITAEYLRGRFGLAGLMPTPAEVGQFLYPSKPVLAERATCLFQACDAARFAPDRLGEAFVADTARDLILELEESEVSASARA